MNGSEYAPTVLQNHLQLIQAGSSKSYKCEFCTVKEFKHRQSLFRHKKEDCKMNPDKKRKTDAEEEADAEMVLHQRAADRCYHMIMASDCTDSKAIDKLINRLEPFAAGLVRQRFVNMDAQFNKDTEEYETKKRENDKVKRVIQSFDASPKSSGGGGGAGGGGAAGGGGGAAGGGGGGIMGYFSSAKK